LGYYPGNCLEYEQKYENLSQGSWYVGRGTKLVLFKHQPGTSLRKLACWVSHTRMPTHKHF